MPVTAIQTLPPSTVTAIQTPPPPHHTVLKYRPPSPPPSRLQSLDLVLSLRGPALCLLQAVTVELSTFLSPRFPLSPFPSLTPASLSHAPISLSPFNVPEQGIRVEYAPAMRAIVYHLADGPVMAPNKAVR